MKALIYASENNFPIVEIPKGNFIIDSVNTLNQRNPEIGGGIKIPSNVEAPFGSRSSVSS